jgi:type II secretory pathway component PulM
MTAWFAELAPREKLLLMVAGLLTVIVIGWLAVARPILAANAEARTRQNASARALDVVATGLPLLSRDAAAPGQGPAMESGDMRRQVTAAAQQTGLLLTQLRSEEDGAVSVVLRDVDPRLVFAFLQLLSTRDGIAPRTATFSQSDGDRVSASFVLVGTGT